MAALNIHPGCRAVLFDVNMPSGIIDRQMMPGVVEDRSYCATVCVRCAIADAEYN